LYRYLEVPKVAAPQEEAPPQMMAVPMGAEGDMGGGGGGGGSGLDDDLQARLDNLRKS
jgi:hypothetical protein